ncbi:MAG: hypothetical protein HQL31_07855, partial [Planctomycetes bacterium]|nr:hypothetical protein [Planctomycetota bacterium]
LTAIASAFGMNVSNGFEHEGVFTFWTIFGIGLGIGLLVAWYLIHKPRLRHMKRRFWKRKKGAGA